MNELKKELAQAKMKKAWETWEEAEWAFQGDKYASAVNRIYYAFYRACLAVLSFQAKIPGKHQAVIGEISLKKRVLSLTSNMKNRKSSNFSKARSTSARFSVSKAASVRPRLPRWPPTC